MNESTIINCVLDGFPHALQCFSMAVTAIDVNLEMYPADNIGVKRTKFDNFTILDRDEVRAFGTCFADMPSLKVSGENHMGILVENNPVMNVTERPIIIALGDEVIECAGCVVRMSVHAAHASVQNADIEEAVDRVWIGGGEVVGDIAQPEALAMKRHAKLLKHECLRFTRGKHLDALGHAQTPRDLAFRIVVAVKDEGRDVRFRKAANLAGEEQPGLIVAPIAIIEIACDHHKIDLLINRFGDEIVESLPRRRTNALDGRPVIPREPPQRTIEVNVCGVNETEGCQDARPTLAALGFSAFVRLIRSSTRETIASRFLGSGGAPDFSSVWLWPSM